jgi:PQQ-dependent catabolism-associated CXXCW motif protein
LGITCASAADNFFDPTSGYRIAHYRSPVPETVDGGTRIFAADVEQLIAQKHAVLIDAMPSEGGRADAETGEWHMLVPHSNIPGSTWLPDVGKGDITPMFEAYFKDNLERLTAGDKSRAIIFYCVSDCWMSWNATKRAASLGYSSLYWFPEGTDGWRDWGGTLTIAKPVPLSTHTKTGTAK